MQLGTSQNTFRRVLDVLRVVNVIGGHMIIHWRLLAQRQENIKTGMLSGAYSGLKKGYVNRWQWQVGNPKLMILAVG